MQTEDLKENNKATDCRRNTSAGNSNDYRRCGNGAQEAAETKSEGAVADNTPEQDEKDAKIEELQNRVLRLQADFDNFRRRNTSEREQLATFVTADVVGKFLKVLDNFERAEAAVQKADDAAGIASGLEMIRRQFEQTFKELGVEEIKADGAKFDPELHEAVMRGQNPDLEDDAVEMVFEKGYKLRDKVSVTAKLKLSATNSC